MGTRCDNFGHTRSCNNREGPCDLEGRNSARPCGCDPAANHVCEWHTKERETLTRLSKIVQENALACEEQMKDTYPATGFQVKDSGQRQQFASGMVRDVTDNKTDYSLALDGPMFDRLAVHLTKGAKKYSKRNWMQASGEPELERFKESALRHFLQWLRGEVDEDHAAAVFFNINGAEYVKARLANKEAA